MAETDVQSTDNRRILGGAVVTLACAGCTYARSVPMRDHAEGLARLRRHINASHPRLSYRTRKAHRETFGADAVDGRRWNGRNKVPGKGKFVALGG